LANFGKLVPGTPVGPRNPDTREVANVGLSLVVDVVVAAVAAVAAAHVVAFDVAVAVVVAFVVAVAVAIARAVAFVVAVVVVAAAVAETKAVVAGAAVPVVVVVAVVAKEVVVVVVAAAAAAVVVVVTLLVVAAVAVDKVGAALIDVVVVAADVVAECAVPVVGAETVAAAFGTKAVPVVDEETVPEASGPEGRVVGNGLAQCQVGRLSLFLRLVDLASFLGVSQTGWMAVKDLEDFSFLLVKFPWRAQWQSGVVAALDSHQVAEIHSSALFPSAVAGKGTTDRCHNFGEASQPVFGLRQGALYIVAAKIQSLNVTERGRTEARRDGTLVGLPFHRDGQSDRVLHIENSSFAAGKFGH
jgi:hypothetical protein